MNGPIAFTVVSSNKPPPKSLRASISIYALAHIVLSIDVHELQIYAGAQKTLGLTVAPNVVEVSPPPFFPFFFFCPLLVRLPFNRRGALGAHNSSDKGIFRKTNPNTEHTRAGEEVGTVEGW